MARANTLARAALLGAVIFFMTVAAFAVGVRAQQAELSEADLQVELLLASVQANLPPRFTCAFHVSMYDRTARKLLPKDSPLPAFRLTWEEPSAIDVTYEFPRIPGLDEAIENDLRERYEFALRQLRPLKVLRLQRFSLFDLLALRVRQVKEKVLLDPEKIDGHKCAVVEFRGMFVPVPAFSAAIRARVWISQVDGMPRRVALWTQKSGVFIADIQYKKHKVEEKHAYLLPSKITVTPRVRYDGPTNANPLVVTFSDYEISA